MGWWIAQARSDTAFRWIFVREYLIVQRSGHPAEFASGVRLQTAGWLQSQAHFLPTAPDLSRGGFDLEGGRLGCYRGKPMAVWVYRQESTPVVLFEQKDEGVSLPRWPVVTSPDGREYRCYTGECLNLVFWKERGRLFSVVAPIDGEAMAKVISRCRERSQG
jgi:anti-sigma factor RsiW